MPSPSLLLLILLGAGLVACATHGPRALPSSGDASVRAEIEELHRFFEGWFTARLANTPSEFARFESVVAPGFVHIPPSGARTEREALLNGLRNAHGVHADDGFRIWIEDVRARTLADGTVLATYEEWQETRGDEPRGRISSVVFRAREDLPNGLEWVHVQETWLAE